ncbi:MAG: AbrB/MazE/SpoVT family DNA-binding domain-containing protein [Synechococcaceae cyanobacterium]|nr:AbrB/MazE/SpoVT family DNA-binding domain-containing protein [Synechococcaceae cyanobacterium]
MVSDSTGTGRWPRRAKLFCNGRSQAVRLPAEFRFEGTEVEVHRDPESGAVVLMPVRPSAKELLELRDALLREPGFREELDAFFEGLHDTSPADPVDVP